MDGVNGDPPPLDVQSDLFTTQHEYYRKDTWENVTFSAASIQSALRNRVNGNMLLNFTGKQKAEKIYHKRQKKNIKQGSKKSTRGFFIFFLDTAIRVFSICVLYAIHNLDV